jgi:TolA-binding protein
VDVVHRPEGRWRLSLGPYSVHVVGTRFGVEFDPANEVLTLEVHEGRVVASGCHLGEGRPVHAGERLSASCKTRQLELVAGERRHTIEPAAQPTRAPAEAETAPPNASARPETASVATPAASKPASWRELLARGDYKGGFSAAKLAGFERECETSGSAELMALGDAARFSGQTAAAEHAYLTLRRRFPGDGRAALAAFSLARIAFDQRGAHAAAARWFETYLRESPGGPLAREALGRLMESLQRSGQSDRARSVAEQYVARHPRGPHAELARRLVGE